MSWHVDDAVLGRYGAGSLDDANALSVEAHLLGCAACRERTAPLADTARLESVWASVQELVDAPRPTPVERLLLRLGVREHVARLLAATPSLTLSTMLCAKRPASNGRSDSGSPSAVTSQPIISAPGASSKQSVLVASQPL